VHRAGRPGVGGGRGPDRRGGRDRRTLGKALGGYGAYVCGSRLLADFLVNSARPFIFSTAPPPPVVAAAHAALGLLMEQPTRVERLRSNAGALRAGVRAEGLEPIGSETQIIPVVIGAAETTMALTERLLERGLFAQGIRPPTVALGTCRLRLATMATHRADDLRRAAAQIGRAARELRIGAAASAGEDDLRRAA